MLSQQQLNYQFQQDPTLLSNIQNQQQQQFQPSQNQQNPQDEIAKLTSLLNENLKQQEQVQKKEGDEASQGVDVYDPSIAQQMQQAQNQNQGQQGDDTGNQLSLDPNQLKTNLGRLAWEGILLSQAGNVTSDFQQKCMAAGEQLNYLIRNYVSVTNVDNFPFFSQFTQQQQLGEDGQQYFQEGDQGENQILDPQQNQIMELADQQIKNPQLDVPLGDENLYAQYNTLQQLQQQPAIQLEDQQNRIL